MTKVVQQFGKAIHNHHVFRIVAIIFYIFQNVPSNFNLEVIPVMIIFLWGIYLVARDFFTHKIMFQAHYSFLLVLILVFYAGSVVANIPYQFPHGPVNWVYLAQSLLLVYPFDLAEPYNQTKKWMIRFNDLIIGLLFLTGLISLILYAFNAQYWVINGSGTTWLRQGFIENRLFGVYTSPNFGSMLGLVSVFLCLINNVLKRGSWKNFQALYVGNIIIQYLYFVLSSSRGTRLSLIAVICCLILCRTIHRMVKGQNYLKKIAQSLGGLAISLFLFFAINTAAQTVLAYVPPMVEIASDILKGDYSLTEGLTRDYSGTASVSPVTLQHSDSGSELSSGRFTIWKGGIAATLQRPILGLSDGDIYSNSSYYETPRQVDTTALDQMDRTELKRASGNMHNAYVSIFVFSGLSGTILFIAWGSLYAYHHLPVLCDKQRAGHSPFMQSYVLILLMLVAILVNNLVETHIVFSNRNSIGFIFWVYAGYLTYLKHHSYMGKIKE